MDYKTTIKTRSWTAMNNETQQTNFSKKRFMHNNPYHSLSSKQDVFDWNNNILTQIKEEEVNPRTIKNKNQSNIFIGESASTQKEDFHCLKKKKIVRDNNKSCVFSCDFNNPPAQKPTKRITALNNNSTEIKNSTIFAGYNKGKANHNDPKKICIKNYCSENNPLGNYDNRYSKNKHSRFGSSIY